MTLTLNTTCDLTIVVSTVLTNFIASPTTFTELIVTAKYNNGEEITRIYSQTNLITATTDISTDGIDVFINPSLFDATIFSNGIYSFSFLLKQTGQTDTDDGCMFVDCTPTDECIGDIKRQIYELDQTDAEFTFKALQYDLLSQISDCQCKCDKAYTIYEDLIDSLNDCKTC